MERIMKAVIIVGIGIVIGLVIGGVMNQYVKSPEATPQKIWPLPSTIMEDIYPAQRPQTTVDEYLIAAYHDAEEMSLYLDIAFPGAKVIWEEHGGFSSKEEIANFLATVQFGCCRHRTAYGYWLVQALNPESEVRAIVGYVYVPSLSPSPTVEEGKVRIVFVDESDGLDTNHAWLTIDGEVFDPSLNPQRVRYYHPYGWSFIGMDDNTSYVKITFPKYGVYREEVEEQFRYDKGLVKTPKEDIPPWWYQD